MRQAVPRALLEGSFTRTREAALIGKMAARIPDARRADDACRTLLALHALNASRASCPKGSLPSVDPFTTRLALRALQARWAARRQLSLHVLLQEVDFLFLAAEAPHLLAHHSHLVSHCAFPVALGALDVAEP
jgi:hypothetical protein